MIHYVTSVIQAVKEVYSSRKYILISIATFLIIFSFNAVIDNYKLLLNIFSPLLFLSLIGSTIKNITAASLGILLILSLLAGVVTSMSIFVLQRQLKGSAGIGISSIITSLIAPSCTSCALGLLSILGLSGVIAFLPFQGVELGIGGIIVMVISIVYLSQKITAKTCILTP